MYIEFQRINIELKNSSLEKVNFNRLGYLMYKVSKDGHDDFLKIIFKNIVKMLSPAEATASPTANALGPTTPIENLFYLSGLNEKDKIGEKIEGIKSILKGTNKMALNTMIDYTDLSAIF
jgi:hypothetical protein